MKPSSIFWTILIFILILIIKPILIWWVIIGITYLILNIYFIMNIIILTEKDSWSLDVNNTDEGSIIKFTITYWIIIFPILVFNKCFNSLFNK